ncbi:MAG: Zn-ribbon containing protein [Candidatus Pacearchaeota archaeon]|jgi:predicted  nucleic acid-binding Zn-ribbon protein
MPHQCVRCSKIIGQGSKELLAGCANCGSHFFFYIKEEQLRKAKEDPIIIPENERDKIEKDVREIAGIEEENQPVILDLESIRISGPGKFEIDVVNLFNEKRPLIYRLEEGKYIIDLATTLGKYTKKLGEDKSHEK